MDKDFCEKRPQVGPDCSAVGESHPASAGCPSYSGVGNKRLLSVPSDTNDNHTRDKRITMKSQHDDHEPSGSKPIEEMTTQCASSVRLPEVLATDIQPSISGRRDGHKRQRDTAADGELLPPSKVPLKARTARGGGPSRNRRGQTTRPRTPRGSSAPCTEDSESDSQSVPPTCQSCTEASEAEGMDVQVSTQITPSSANVESSAGSAEALEKEALQDIQVVLDTTRKSKNMKGTCQRAIKEAAERVRMAIEGLASRSSSEETRRLQLENDRLRKEVGALRKEMEALREEVRSMGRQRIELPQPHSVSSSIVENPSSDELLRAAVSQIGKMMDARFAGIEDRLLPAKSNRPPLAADVKKAAKNATNTNRRPKKPSMASREAFQAAFQVVSQAAETQRGALPPSSLVANTQTLPDPTPSTSTNDGWQTAVKGKRKRGEKKKKALAPNIVVSATEAGAGSGSGRKRKRRLRAPKSAAVVLTLQPEAVQRGLTYAGVLSRAKESINLADLGITAIRFRQAATGARLLEFPGTEGTKGADLIAEKLRGIFAEDVKISRPTKCAEMRISGLDDSIAGRDVLEAIARKTGCPPEVVRVGLIRPGPGGVGSAWAQCPVEVAKQLADAGRLLVGWSSARVRILEARPMRCFKCMERGHIRHNCTSGTDLSGHCFRCGMLGHLASTCSADPHCPLCEVAKLPANHVVGSKSCKPPALSKRKETTASTPAASSEVRLEQSQKEIMISD